MKTYHIKDTTELMKSLMSKPMYFYNDFEECVVRTEPNKEGIDIEYYIKYKGELEFKTSRQNNNSFETVMIDRVSIEKMEYDKF